MNKKVCFIGHRNTPNSKELNLLIKNTISDLINKENVTEFLFGSRSNFDTICHTIVTEFQTTYSQIERVSYSCKHEYAILKSKKEETEEMLCKVLKHPVCVTDYDKEIEYRNKYTSGKASYVERNQAMIDDSDFCIFYFDENYKPLRRKNSKNDISTYQPNSGTALAYKYAVTKNKNIINLYNKLKI